MRVLIDQEARLLPIQDKGHIEILGAYNSDKLVKDVVLVGPSPFEKLDCYLKNLPLSLGRERLRQYLESGNIRLVDVNQKPTIRESEGLAPGDLVQLMNQEGYWDQRLESMRRSTASNEDRNAAFDRTLGMLMPASKAIDVVDRYLTWPLLSRALGENTSEHFFIRKLLGSGAETIKLYLGDPTDFHLRNSDGFDRSRARQLSEVRRIEVIMDFFLTQTTQMGVKLNIDLNFSKSMPHDRYVRLALAGKGMLFFVLTKGTDMFELDPVGGVYSLEPKGISDWQNLMSSIEWKPNRRNTSIGLTKPEQVKFEKIRERSSGGSTLVRALQTAGG